MNGCLTIAERVEKYGPLKTYLDLVDSLNYPNHFGHEEIFRQGGPSGARQTMEDLVTQIPIDDIHFALDALRPNKFDFEIPFVELLDIRVRNRTKEMASVRVK